MTTSKQAEQSTHSTPELVWSEEWVPLASVIKHQPLQVRTRLDSRAITLYASMTKEGSKPPPIKLARSEGRLYLLDGWHRMAAGALQLRDDPDEWMGQQQVLALVADMPAHQMPWEAARANLGHGVQYRAKEFRPVFRAFIGSKQHHKSRREYMSYREMAEAFGLGVSHVTLRKWVMADFPKLAAALSKHDYSHDGGGWRKQESVSMEKQHSGEAHKALAAVRQHAELLETPQNRWDVLQALEATAAMLRAKGVLEPEF